MLRSNSTIRSWVIGRGATMPDSAVWIAEASGEPIRIGSTRCGSGCSRRMTTGVFAGTSTRTPINSIAITIGAYLAEVGRTPVG